jgi:hypothetical protein
MRSRPRTGAATTGCTPQPDEQTHIWNSLFQGSLLIQQVRLRFHDSNEADVLTVVALDLRAEGWVVTGRRDGSQRSVEHYLHRIREVEVLGDSPALDELDANLPPMA